MGNSIQRKTFLLFILSLALFIPTFSQQTNFFVTGNIYDSKTKAALSNVNISIVGTRKGIITNKEGFFKLELKKIPALLYFSHIGYKIDNYQVNEKNIENLKIYLDEETMDIEEVVVSAERIQKIIKEDTLNIVDYHVLDDRIIMVANPYKMKSKQRIYLTTLQGVPISSKKIKKAGKYIKQPEDWLKKAIFLFKDCFGNSHLLTKDSTWQIYINNDSIELLYPSDYPEFMSLIFPIKQELDGNIYYQFSGQQFNSTYFRKKGKNQKRIKVVRDPLGNSRYVRDPMFPNRMKKMVSAPIIKNDDEIIIFDFFGNNIEFFNMNGEHEKEVPISFHIKQFTRFLFFTYYDIDQKNFRQKILFDEVTKKAYALYRKKSYGKFSLKEIDLESGEIVKIIEIPNLPYIENIQVKNNVIYFLYLNKLKNYKILYRMFI